MSNGDIIVPEVVTTAAVQGVPAITFSRDQIELIKRTVAKNTSDDELALFLYQAKRTGLDPLAGQVHCVKRKSKDGEDSMSIQTAIDGYRLIADRTKAYAGNDDPVFDDEASPKKATVTVYKMVSGQKCPFTATARWEQYYPGGNRGFMWDKMPHLMLGKCAEALALRKAFPAELSGTYINEEMDQEGSTQSSATEPKPAQLRPTPAPADIEIYEGPVTNVTEKPVKTAEKTIIYYSVYTPTKMFQTSQKAYAEIAKSAAGTSAEVQIGFISKEWTKGKFNHNMVSIKLLGPVAEV